MNGKYFVAMAMVVVLGVGLPTLLWLGTRKAMARHVYLVLGLLGIGVGGYLGLFVAPPEREMGDVYRIIYVHVPAVWMALTCFTVNVVASVAYLWKASWKWDSLAEASAEIGVLMGGLGVLLGSIWGRPTWGVYWSWDPRLTTAAICIVAYTGYMALRRFIEDPEKRARWSSVVGIIAYVDIPIIWFSVKWWNSLHQQQSTPQTVDSPMASVLRFNAFAFFFLTLAYMSYRFATAQAARRREVALPSALPPLEAAR